MPASMPSSVGGGGTKPSFPANGSQGRAVATATTVSDRAASQGFGRLAKGLPRVRMMKMTRTCEAIDSMNQPVWNRAAPAWNNVSMR